MLNNWLFHPYSKKSHTFRLAQKIFGGELFFGKGGNCLMFGHKVSLFSTVVGGGHPGKGLV